MNDKFKPLMVNVNDNHKSLINPINNNIKVKKYIVTTKPIRNSKFRKHLKSTSQDRSINEICKNKGRDRSLKINSRRSSKYDNKHYVAKSTSIKSAKAAHLSGNIFNGRRSLATQTALHSNPIDIINNLNKNSLSKSFYGVIKIYGQKREKSNFSLNKTYEYGKHKRLSKAHDGINPEEDWKSYELIEDVNKLY